MLGMTILYLHMDEENMKNRRGKKRKKKKKNSTHLQAWQSLVAHLPDVVSVQVPMTTS